MIVVPIVLVVIFGLLYLTYHSAHRSHSRVLRFRLHSPVAFTALAAWLQLFGCGVGRIHCAVWNSRSDRRGDGHLSQRSSGKETKQELGH